MTTKFDIGETVYVPCKVIRINVDNDFSEISKEYIARRPRYTLETENNETLYLSEAQILKYVDVLDNNVGE